MTNKEKIDKDIVNAVIRKIRDGKLTPKTESKDVSNDVNK